MLTWRRLGILNLFRPPQSLENRSSGELHLLVVGRHPLGKVSAVNGHNPPVGHEARHAIVVPENLPFDHFARAGRADVGLERILASLLKN